MERIEDGSEISTRRLAAEVRFSQFLVHRRIKEQGLHPYHVQNVQALVPVDFPGCVIYREWLLQQYRERPNFLNCILFTNEAGFTRSAVFSSHNLFR